MTLWRANRERVERESQPRAKIICRINRELESREERQKDTEKSSEVTKNEVERKLNEHREAANKKEKHQGQSETIHERTDERGDERAARVKSPGSVS